MTKSTSLFNQLRQLLQFSRVGKEFFWITFGQAIAVIGGLVGLRLLTDYLTPATFGELALFMTIATLMNQILLGPLAGAALRFLSPAYEVNNLRAYLYATRILLKQITILIIIATVIGCLALLFFRRLDWIFFLGAASTFALLTGYNLVLNGMQNALRQRKIVAWHAAIGQWLQVGFVLATVIYLGPTTQFAVLGYILAAFFILPSQLYFFRQKVLSLIKEEKQSTSIFKDTQFWQDKMKSYALPFTGWGFFTWAQMSSDRWALQATIGTTGVGLFSVLYRLGYYPISLITNLVVQLLTPILFQKAGDASNPSRMNATYRANHFLVAISLGMTLMAFATTYFLHTPIFNLAVSSDYHSVSRLLPWMILAGGLNATGQIATIGLLSESETKTLLLPKISTAIIGITLNFISAYFWGLPGIVTAVSLTATIYFIWILLLGNYRQKQRSNKPKETEELNHRKIDSEQRDLHETTI